VFAYPEEEARTKLQGFDISPALFGPSTHAIFVSPTDVFFSKSSVFEQVFERVGLHENRYRARGIFKARRMADLFSLRETGGEVRRGKSGDYVVESEHGEQWIQNGETFDDVYVLAHSDVDGQLAIIQKLTKVEDAITCVPKALAAQTVDIPLPASQGVKHVISQVALTIFDHTSPTSSSSSATHFLSASSASDDIEHNVFNSHQQPTYDRFAFRPKMIASAASTLDRADWKKCMEVTI